MTNRDVLDHVRFRVKEPPRVFTVAKQKGPLRTFEGLTLTPHYTFADAPAIDPDEFSKLLRSGRKQDLETLARRLSERRKTRV